MCECQIVSQRSSIISSPLHCSQDVRAKYRAGPKLGQGSWGTVLGVTDRATNKRFACKSIDVKSRLRTSDGPHLLDRLRNEISVMSYLAGHPNIVQLQASAYG